MFQNVVNGMLLALIIISLFLHKDTVKQSETMVLEIEARQNLHQSNKNVATYEKDVPVTNHLYCASIGFSESNELTGKVGEACFSDEEKRDNFVKDYEPLRLEIVSTTYPVARGEMQILHSSENQDIELTPNSIVNPVTGDSIILKNNSLELAGPEIIDSSKQEIMKNAK